MFGPTRAFRAEVCFLVCLLVMPATVAAQDPPKEYKESYQEPFKGQPQKAGDFTLFGADAKQCVQFEPEGLRITLPAGKGRGPIGVATAFGVAGDFEITVRYEMLQEPEPADAGMPLIGTRISLTATLDRPTICEASIRRKITPALPVHILAYTSMRKDADAKPKNLDAKFPVKEKTGRLRLVRLGANIAYYLSAGLDDKFTLLATHPFGADDLKDVRIHGHTSSPNAALDARITDLQIRAASLPRKPTPPKIEQAGEPKIPTKDYAQTYEQSFQGSGTRPAGWNYISRLSEECVQFEKAGLRFVLPASTPANGQTVGTVTGFGVKGDFEITLSFDVLKDPAPADVGTLGMRLSLVVTLDTPLLDTPKSEVATMNRSSSAKGEPNFVTWMRSRERPQSASKLYPTSATTGRLRLVRSGDELYYLASVGVDAPFKFLTKFRFGADELKRVAITAATGSDKAELDLRVTDFRIRADAIPGAPASEAVAAQPIANPPLEATKGGLIVALLCGAAVTLVLALGAWFVLRKRGNTAEEAPLDAARPFISFACSKCAKALKTKPDMAGKKVKCARCGTAVSVPSIQEQ